MIYFYRVIVSNFKYDWSFAFVTRKPKFWIVNVMHHLMYQEMDIDKFSVSYILKSH